MWTWTVYKACTLSCYNIYIFAMCLNVDKVFKLIPFRLALSCSVASLWLWSQNANGFFDCFRFKSLWNCLKLLALIVLCLLMAVFDLHNFLRVWETCTEMSSFLLYRLINPIFFILWPKSFSLFPILFPFLCSLSSRRPSKAPRAPVSGSGPLWPAFVTSANTNLSLNLHPLLLVLLHLPFQPLHRCLKLSQSLLSL